MSEVVDEVACAQAHATIRRRQAARVGLAWRSWARVRRRPSRLLVEMGTASVWTAYESTVQAWWTVHESIRT